MKEKFLELSTKKSFNNCMKRTLELEKIIKRKCCKLYVIWKGYNSLSHSCIKYFQEPKSSRANLKFYLGLSNYVTKADFKNVTKIDTSDLPKKIDLSNLKFDQDKFDTDKSKYI